MMQQDQKPALSDQELASAAGVTIVSPLMLRCDECGDYFTPVTDPARLKDLLWCQRGCNRPELSSSDA